MAVRVRYLRREGAGAVFGEDSELTSEHLPEQHREEEGVHDKRVDHVHPEHQQCVRWDLVDRG
jgi:hypothetical protein